MACQVARGMPAYASFDPNLQYMSGMDQECWTLTHAQDVGTQVELAAADEEGVANVALHHPLTQIGRTCGPCEAVST